ncbi:MAG: hypothetical protein QNJ47_14715 [Nostocaceae cyanobacterium]|nr:hypothetical protein [Nostocaceae cyanobacterium]
MASPALTEVIEQTNMTIINGKDVVGDTLPLIVNGSTTPEEFQASTTWGRVIRIRQNGNSDFFDLGIDKDGNFFINTPSSNATNHALTIARDGTVTIPKLVTP